MGVSLKPKGNAKAGVKLKRNKTVERIEFEENSINVSQSMSITANTKDGNMLIEIESTDYYAHGICYYSLTPEQIEKLKSFLNENGK